MKTILIIVLVFISSSLLFADIINVPADTSTIQGGIYLASEGDTVLVSENTYYENINFKGKAITVASEFIMDGDTSHISRTVIDGSKPSDPDSGTVVYIVSGEDSTTVLCGFTITHGTGTIYTYYDDIDKKFLTLKEAGGILIDSSGATIRHNYIINNRLSDYYSCDGGGLAAWFILEDKRLIIEDNIIRDNIIYAPQISGSGGLCVVEVKGSCLIKRNQILHNSVTVEADFKAVGGGFTYSEIFNGIGEVIITENIIAFNELHCKYGYGAGMYFVYWEPSEGVNDHNAGPIVFNNIISNNYSQDAGAGIGVWYGHKRDPQYYDLSPQPAFINNTIVNNKAARGSGMYCWNASVLLMNNILWNDISSPNGSEIDLGKGGGNYWDKYPNSYNRIYIHNSIISDGNWSDYNNKVFATHPLFMNPSYHLSENSPAVGLGRKSISVDGSTYHAPFYDIDGNIRPSAIDTLIDAGAFESPYIANEFVNPKYIEIIDEITYLNPTTDNLGLTAEIYNPDNHSINIFARIVSVDNALKDSVELYDDGGHNDGEAGDLVFGGEFEPINEENEFKLSLGIKDNDTGNYSIYNNSKRITTVGKITVNNHNWIKLFGTVYAISFALKNEGKTATAKDVTIELTTTDTSSVFSITDRKIEPIDVPAGQVVEIGQSHNINFKSTVSDSVPFTIRIFSNGYHFWTDSHHVVTALDYENQQIPKTYSLAQNYPNPFNPSTTIEFTLPKSEFVELKVYNILGKEVSTLVSNKLNQGNHTYTFDGRNLASGIYYYQLIAGDFREVKKMILLR